MALAAANAECSVFVQCRSGGRVQGDGCGHQGYYEQESYEFPMH
jgi:hypothetical protein